MLTAILMTALLPIWEQPPERQRSRQLASMACNATLQVVKNIVRVRGKLLIFTSWDHSRSPIARAGATYDWGLTNYGRAHNISPPSQALVAKAGSEEARSAVAQCAEVRRFLATRSIPHGPEAYDQIKKERPNEDWTIVSVSLAVIAPDERSALIATGYTGLQGGGGGWLVGLVQDGQGKWRESQTAPTWIG